MNLQQPPTDKWTSDTDEQLIRLVAEGFTISEIQRVLNKSHSTIRYKLQKFGLTPVKKKREYSSKYSEATLQKASELWNKGRLTSNQIADALGMVETTFREIRSRNPDLFYKREAVPPAKVYGQEKPSPENTVIQYDFEEIEMPKDALNLPLMCLEVGQCSWVSGGFWDEVTAQTPCCGLPVVDRRGRGLVKSYCRLHYEASIVKE